ncbi:hypothetical protein TNCV_586971 [Trichonephila clavipes]|nr:hypothetical protein TNCV_586971 [Trichonephila clavipes]
MPAFHTLPITCTLLAIETAEEWYKRRLYGRKMMLGYTLKRNKTTQEGEMASQALKKRKVTLRKISYSEIAFKYGLLMRRSCIAPMMMRWRYG